MATISLPIVPAPVEYRDIAGFPGYRVGADGSVWGCRSADGSLSGSWGRMTQYRRPYGCRYFVIGLRAECNGKLRILYVHRLVLESFVGPCPPGMVACHNDGDTTNNRINNLRWDTQAANLADARRHGTMPAGNALPRPR